MSRRTRNAVAAVALLILGLPIVAALALFIVANTEGGTRWAVARASSAVPGSLEIRGLEGTLWRGVTLDGLSYQYDGRQVEADDLALEFDWLALLAKRVTVRQLSAASIGYASSSASPSSGAGFDISLQPLPVDIVIEKASVRNLALPGAAAGQIRNVAIDEAWSNGRRIRAGSIAATVRDIAVTAGNASVMLDGQVPIAGSVRWRWLGKPWSGRGNVRGTLAEITFDQFVEGPYAATTSGSLLPFVAGGPQLDAIVNWEQWVFGQVRIDDGEAHVRGWIDAYQLDYDATLGLPDQPSFGVRGQAAGDASGISNFAASFDNTAASLEAAGTVRWNPEIAVDADVHIVEADAETFIAALQGRLTGNVHLGLDAAGLLSFDGQAAIGKNELRANGTVSGRQLAAAGRFDFADLDALVKGLSGSASGTGKLSGPVEAPLLSLNIRGRQLQFADSGPQLDVDASGTVSRREGGFAAVVEAASVMEPRTGTWTLDRRAEARFDAGNITVTAHEWSGSIGALRVSRLELADDQTIITARLDRLPLSLADAWMPPNARLLGTATAAIDLSRLGDQWSGTATWSQADTILRVTGDDGEQTDVSIPRANADARLDGGRLAAEAEIAVEPGVTGSLKLELAALAADAPVSAALELHGSDWGWITAIVPQVDRFEGAIGASVSATGPLSAPALAGTVEWHDGRLRVPALNVPLDDIDIVVTGGSQGTASLEGSARAGDGTLALNGKFDNLMNQSRSLELRVQGKSAELINWPEYHVWATPDVVITGDAGGWQVAGDVTLPRADVAMRKLPEEAVSVSGDVVILGEEAVPPRVTRISGDVHLVLGERVRINALGLDSYLRGDLQLRKRQDRQPTAEGRISLVEGVFEAYGQKLSIRQGELTFTGPLDDPIVDVRAIRKIETIDTPVVAGLHLTGRARDLTITVFSEPAMAEADALSYLVVGRPLNQATEAEGGDLAGAAVALGIKQASRLVDQIGRTVGLDQLSLTGDGGDSTALVAGKQVNRRLYARYAYGVFSRLGVLLLRYRMGDRLTLEAATGESQSIDVLYSIETD